MKTTLRLGRIGPVTFDFHYTWLFLWMIALWWMALTWLPDAFPAHGPRFYWFVAALVPLLYMVCVVLHELVHAQIAGTTERHAIVYPFGTAAPVTEEDMQVRAGRVVLAVIAGPLFNVVLGGLLLGLSNTDLGGLEARWADTIHAIAALLGWFNVGLGVVNVLPGIPFDGGWFIASVANWFSGDRDGGVRTARFLGNLIAVGLVLLGAWRGLSGEGGLLPVALIILAWCARDGEQYTRQRTLMHTAFRELEVDEVMDATSPSDAVKIGDSVARMVASHNRYLADDPLPVLDDTRQLVGITTISAAEGLLQGKWSSTSVSAVMDPLPAIEGLPPKAPLTEALEMIERRGGHISDQKPIPIIEGTHFLGSLHPTKIAALERADVELSGEGTPEQRARGLGGWLRSYALPIIAGGVIVAVLAIAGNTAFNANPNNVKTAEMPSASAAVFLEFSPADGSTLTADNTSVSVRIIGERAIKTAYLSLDGHYLNTVLASDRLNDRLASAPVEGLTPGTHTFSVLAILVDGRVEKTEWHFNVQGQ